MPEPWIHPGATILVASGPFADFEAVVDSIDAPADAVLVKLEVFGRPVPLTFPLSSASEHLAPFRDQPAIWTCPNSDLRQQDLLSRCPQAAATYRTDAWWSTTLAFIQASRSGSEMRLSVRSHDLTRPYAQNIVWAVKEVPLGAAEWATLTRLIEESRFWQLPYDDGRRVPRKEGGTMWRLEAYAGERYHALVRQARGPQSEISVCCEYLRSLAALGDQ